MTFLPVVARELRVASRRGRVYWARVGGVAVAIAAFIWIWLVMRHESSSALATVLYSTIGGLAFLYSLLAGITTTSDTISEEKREGTLGLLFLTDLKGYDVVLGKLTATSLNAFYQLISVFPILAIPLLMGGLTGSEFWRMTLALIVTLGFSLAAGMFGSTISKSQQQGALAAFFIILFVSGLGPFLGMIEGITTNQAPSLWYFAMSPGFSFGTSFEAAYARVTSMYWVSIGIVAGAAIVLLILASIVTPRVWQDRPASKRKASWRERWNLWAYGNSAERKKFRRRLLDVNPYFWLAARSRLKPMMVWFLLGALAAVWAYCFFRWEDIMLEEAMHVVVALVLFTFLKLWVTAEAVRTLWEDRRGGSLELLLSTPLSVQVILAGQLRALQRTFLGPVVVVLLVVFAMYVDGRSMYTSEEWTLMFLAWSAMFIMDLVTLSWIGMWLGLTSRRANQAAGGSVGRILVLPWVLVCLIMTVWVLGRRPEPSSNGMILLWFGVGAAVNIFFFVWAYTNLHEQFREIATQPLETRRRGWVSRLIGRR